MALLQQAQVGGGTYNMPSPVPGMTDRFNNIAGYGAPPTSIQQAGVGGGNYRSPYVAAPPSQSNLGPSPQLMAQIQAMIDFNRKKFAPQLAQLEQQITALQQRNDGSAEYQRQVAALQRQYSALGLHGVKHIPGALQYAPSAADSTGATRNLQSFSPTPSPLQQSIPSGGFEATQAYAGGQPHTLPQPGGGDEGISPGDLNQGPPRVVNPAYPDAYYAPPELTEEQKRQGYIIQKFKSGAMTNPYIPGKTWPEYIWYKGHRQKNSSVGLPYEPSRPRPDEGISPGDLERPGNRPPPADWQPKRPPGSGPIVEQGWPGSGSAGTGKADSVRQKMQGLSGSMTAAAGAHGGRDSRIGDDGRYHWAFEGSGNPISMAPEDNTIAQPHAQNQPQPSYETVPPSANPMPMPSYTPAPVEQTKTISPQPSHTEQGYFSASSEPRAAPAFSGPSTKPATSQPMPIMRGGNTDSGYFSYG